MLTDEEAKKLVDLHYGGADSVKVVKVTEKTIIVVFHFWADIFLGRLVNISGVWYGDFDEIKIKSNCNYDTELEKTGWLKPERSGYFVVWSSYLRWALTPCYYDLENDSYILESRSIARDPDGKSGIGIFNGSEDKSIFICKNRLYIFYVRNENGILERKTPWLCFEKAKDFISQLK